MNDLRAVLFDVDGVLLDSLTPHLRICEDKNVEYGLGLTIPNPSQLKEIVRRGVCISPMNYFFLAVGFPNEYAEQAFSDYKRIFMEQYAPAPFPNVNITLSKLHTSGLLMGIVTSNYRANVASALGDSMKLFHEECIFSKDNMIDTSKKDALISATRTLGVEPTESIYVGDQPADWQAAKAARLQFLGVTYGWGISADDKAFPKVSSVSEISDVILQRATNVI